MFGPNDMTREQLLEVQRLINEEIGNPEWEAWSFHDGLARYISLLNGRVIVYAVDGEGNSLVQSIFTQDDWQYLDGIAYRLVYQTYDNDGWIDVAAVEGFSTEAAAEVHAKQFVGRDLASITCQIGSRILTEADPNITVTTAVVETYTKLTGATNPLVSRQL